MKEKRIGYVDLNKDEFKLINESTLEDDTGFICKYSIKSKKIAKEYCNKENKAKVYEVILREVK